MNRFAIWIALASFSALLSCAAAQPIRGLGRDPSAQAARSERYQRAWEAVEAARIVDDVRHNLLSLPEYGVFDSVAFGIEGNKVLLRGYASRPILKSAAEKVVKKVRGVGIVDNRIEVLPNSPNDDSIRIGVYQRVYGEPALRKYIDSPTGLGDLDSLARAAGGVTVDPPRGYHAIHIIVDRGHVILTGVVDRESDANIATMQANSTPGALGVENELHFPGRRTKE